LCAERLTKSAPIRAVASASLPAPCTASQWKRAPCACAERGDFGGGSMIPVSLLATHNRHDRRARVAGKLPFEPGQVDDPVARRPILSARGTASKTELCSTAETRMRSRPLPISARWFASVPPLRKITPRVPRRSALPPRRAPARRFGAPPGPAMDRRGIAAAGKRRCNRRRRLGAQRRGRIPIEISLAPGHEFSRGTNRVLRDALPRSAPQRLAGNELSDFSHL